MATGHGKGMSQYDSPGMRLAEAKVLCKMSSLSARNFSGVSRPWSPKVSTTKFEAGMAFIPIVLACTQHTCLKVQLLHRRILLCSISRMLTSRMGRHAVYPFAVLSYAKWSSCSCPEELLKAQMHTFKSHVNFLPYGARTSSCAKVYRSSVLRSSPSMSKRQWVMACSVYAFFADVHMCVL